jgi:hypothetical protein
MRLLNTTTFELKEFFGSNIPPYSILSHVQGSSEVTFQDLLNGRGPTREGWEKILGCCAQARKDGWKYIVCALPHFFNLSKSARSMISQHEMLTSS